MIEKGPNVETHKLVSSVSSGNMPWDPKLHAVVDSDRASIWRIFLGRDVGRIREGIWTRRETRNRKESYECNEIEQLKPCDNTEVIREQRASIKQISKGYAISTRLYSEPHTAHIKSLRQTSLELSSHGLAMLPRIIEYPVCSRPPPKFERESLRISSCTATLDFNRTTEGQKKF